VKPIHDKSVTRILVAKSFYCRQDEYVSLVTYIFPPLRAIIIFTIVGKCNIILRDGPIKKITILYHVHVPSIVAQYNYYLRSHFKRCQNNETMS
jgi:hypothetical protein